MFDDLAIFQAEHVELEQHLVPAVRMRSTLAVEQDNDVVLTHDADDLTLVVRRQVPRENLTERLREALQSLPDAGRMLDIARAQESGCGGDVPADENGGIELAHDLLVAHSERLVRVRRGSKKQNCCDDDANRSDRTLHGPYLTTASVNDAIAASRKTPVSRALGGRLISKRLPWSQ